MKCSGWTIFLIVGAAALLSCKPRKSVPSLIEKGKWGEACQLYAEDPFLELGMNEHDFEDALQRAIDARVHVSAWSNERLEALLLMPPPDPYCSTSGLGALVGRRFPVNQSRDRLPIREATQLAMLDITIEEVDAGNTGARISLRSANLMQGYDRDPSSSVATANTRWRPLLSSVHDSLSPQDGAITNLFALGEASARRTGRARDIAKRIASGTWGRMPKGGIPSECEPFGFEETFVKKEARAEVAQALVALTRPCPEGARCAESFLLERELFDRSESLPRWLELELDVMLTSSAGPCNRSVSVRVPLPEAPSLQESLATRFPEPGASLRALTTQYDNLPSCVRFHSPCDEQDGMTRDTCWLTGACVNSGQCEPGQGKRGCAARRAQDCLASGYCQSLGACVVGDAGRCVDPDGAGEGCGLPCLETAACQPMGTSTGGRINCQAVKGAACAESAACREAGRCAHDLISCVVSDSEACTKSEVCREYGWCEQEGRACRPGAASHCASSISCKRAGACGLVESRCRPTDASHCANSSLCKSAGRCALDKGRCVAKRSADCAQSETCRSHGRCEAKSGVCVRP